MDYTIEADLDVRSAVPWDDVHATPINDLRCVRVISKERYGVELEYALMSRGTARLIVASEEFQANAKHVMCPGPDEQNPPDDYFYLRHFKDFLFRITPGLWVAEFDNRFPIGLVTLSPFPSRDGRRIARVRGL